MTIVTAHRELWRGGSIRSEARPDEEPALLVHGELLCLRHSRRRRLTLPALLPVYGGIGYASRYVCVAPGCGHARLVADTDTHVWRALAAAGLIHPDTAAATIQQKRVWILQIPGFWVGAT